MRLSEVERIPSFALLGPGFGGWLLLTDLREGDEVPALVAAPYEGAWRVFGARRLDGFRLELDVAPPLPKIAIDTTGHAQAVREIRERIAAGDVYQVNLTLRARLFCSSGAALFSRMCARALPRFAAWVRFPDGTELVSASPEMLFASEGGLVRVEPMKGTAAPGGLEVLRASRKDLAELAMITDLLRNDLTPSCTPRSVRVACERRFIDLPYVVQAVSDVVGTLRPRVAASDVLRALHPSGSVTGAPKSMARKIIRELETTPRGFYSGSLAFFEGERAVASVLIRTAERRSSTEWMYGTGGGIVWDSTPEAELAELQAKLGALR